jgi:hypothetical protein
LNSPIRHALALAREAVRDEKTTVPGRVNVVGLFFVLVLLVSQGLADWFQAFVRLFNADYTTGRPSFLAILAIYVVMFLGCVGILAAALPRTDRPEHND